MSLRRDREGASNGGPPELQQLLALSRDRTAYQNPLFQAVSQMAYAGLPTYARQGTQLSGTLSNQAPPMPAQSGGGMNPLLAAGLGGLGGAALRSLADGGGDIGKLIRGIKKLLATKTRTVQGNRPYGGGALTGGLQPAQYPFPGFAGNEGMDPNRWPGANPNVSTEESFSWPNDVFNDPYFLNSQSNGMPNDPSGGSGVGPGMQDYYNSGGSGFDFSGAGIPEIDGGGNNGLPQLNYDDEGYF